MEFLPQPLGATCTKQQHCPTAHGWGRELFLLGAPWRNACTEQALNDANLPRANEHTTSTPQNTQHFSESLFNLLLSTYPSQLCTSNFDLPCSQVIPLPPSVHTFKHTLAKPMAQMGRPPHSNFPIYTLPWCMTTTTHKQAPMPLDELPTSPAIPHQPHHLSPNNCIIEHLYLSHVLLHTLIHVYRSIVLCTTAKANRLVTPPPIRALASRSSTLIPTASPYKVLPITHCI